MKKLGFLLSVVFAILFVASTFAQDPGPVLAKSITAKVEIRGPFAASDVKYASDKASVVTVEMQVYSNGSAAVATEGYEITTTTSVISVFKDEITTTAGMKTYRKQIPISGMLTVLVPFKAKVYVKAQGSANTSYASAYSTLKW